MFGMEKKKRLHKDKKCPLMIRMKGKTYTVREIAAIISGSDNSEVIERMVRRVRYWTNEGALKPIGGKRHTGSGNHREYDADEVRKAAIAAELSRYGISLGKIIPFDVYLEDIKRGELWKRAVEGTDNIYIVHSEEFGEEGGDMTGFCSELESRKDSVVSPMHVVSSRGRMVPDNPTSLDYDDYPSSLVINITKLFAKLRM
jgi:hypothetical protein